MAATAAAPKKSEVFKPPVVEEGMVVQWKHHPSDIHSSPALVTSNNGFNLCLLVFNPNFSNGSPKEGVIHADDPNLFMKDGGMRSEGCWQLSERDTKINKLLDEFGK